MDKQPVKNFRDLVVWQKSHELVLFTYEMTKRLPKEEKFGLVPQMRRAAVSITSNIAEGFGRFSHKDREHFYVMSYASLTELDNHYQIALDLKYIDQAIYANSQNLVNQSGRLLNSLQKTHRSKSNS